MRSFRATRSLRAFTAVELIVTVLLVGIISTMAVFGYGAWRDRLALAEVRSDLLNVKAAMDNHKAWNNGYPELEDDAEFNGNPATVSLFTQSPNVKVVYFEGDSKAYCIDGVSQVRPNIGLYITSDSNGTIAEPTRGTCVGGEGSNPTPTGDEWIQFVYDMNAPGCSGSTIRLPISYPNSDPGSRIDWGDGKSETRTTPSPQHKYKKPRKYIISYKPGSQTVPTRISTSSFGATPETRCMTEVRQWGNGSPSSVSLRGSSNLVKVPDYIPESVTDLSGGLEGASSFNQDISSWDVSNVKIMSSLFKDATAFNQPLDSWDVSSVTNMGGMFNNARSFNQSISSWRPAKLIDISEIFKGATSFNQPINDWGLKGSIDVRSAFEGAFDFNQPLDNWHIRIRHDGDAIFKNAKSFNQSVNHWQVSGTMFMREVFSGAENFNQPLDGWNMGGVERVNGMFRGAKSFNQPIGGWNMSRVIDASGMFDGAESFNQPLNSWNTVRMWGGAAMFRFAKSFNQPLNNWNTSKVKYMEGLFAHAEAFNQPLNGWDTSKVVGMREMFTGALSFNQDLSGWNVDAVSPQPPDYFSLNAHAWTLPKPRPGW